MVIGYLKIIAEFVNLKKLKSQNVTEKETKNKTFRIMQCVYIHGNMESRVYPNMGNKSQVDLAK